MQDRLTAAGMRPISLAVDVTNYVMLDLGQPLHAFDADKLTAPIVVRRAKDGERLTFLDEVTRSLDPEDLVIADSPDGEGSRALVLAGVFGGALSEVDADTRDVLIEAAHFDPVSVARSSRRHKLPTESSKRNERGVDTELAPIAAQRAVDLLVEYGGGTAEPVATDINRTRVPEPITMRAAAPAPVPRGEGLGPSPVDMSTRCRSVSASLLCSKKTPISPSPEWWTPWMGTPWQPPTPGNFTDSELSSPRSILWPATVMDRHSVSSLLIE